MIKSDIILAGVGGQGILSIAATIGMAAVNSKLFLKQSEVHGMSQRGGDVQSNLRISEKEILSDLIPFGGADLILSVEPMESLRYLPYLKKNGWLVTNTNPFINIPNYPQIDDILEEVKKVENHIIVDADKIAKEMGSSRSSNIVMLGAASPYMCVSYENLQEGLRFIFGRKGEKVLQSNLDALKAGRELSINK